MSLFARVDRATRVVAVPVMVMIVAIATATPVAADPHPNGESLACGQEINRTDENGTFTLRFQCLPTRGLLNWGFTFNPQWRAMAIGPVSEQGMRYWRNRVEMPMNSPHVEPVEYLYHGTLPDVLVGEDIDYQNFFAFKADFGASTGSARVAFAGSVILKP